MINRIKSALSAAGITVYDPGVKIGVCSAAYAVARSLGTETMPGSKACWAANYEVLLIVPCQPGGFALMAASAARRLRLCVCACPRHDQDLQRPIGPRMQPDLHQNIVY